MEKLIRNSINRKESLGRKVFDALRTGGISLMVAVPDEEKISEVEEQGFQADKVQGYLDVLEANGQFKTAAMLRGAFNDLIGRAEQINNTTEA